MPGETNEGYDLGLVCQNGHPINAYAESQPENNRDFCEECGEEAISACPSCSTEIPGESTVGGVFSQEPYEPPNFCGSCGEPYPWTQRRIEAAREMAQEMEGLDEEERQQLEESIEDLVRDTPRTKLAAQRVKTLLGKARGEIPSMFKETLLKVATSQAKELLLGSVT